MEAYAGIDLYSSNSCIAVIDEQEALLLQAECRPDLKSSEYDSGH